MCLSDQLISFDLVYLFISRLTFKSSMKPTIIGCILEQIIQSFTYNTKARKNKKYISSLWVDLFVSRCYKCSLTSPQLTGDKTVCGSVQVDFTLTLVPPTAEARSEACSVPPTAEACSAAQPCYLLTPTDHPAYSGSAVLWHLPSSLSFPLYQVERQCSIPMFILMEDSLNQFAKNFPAFFPSTQPLCRKFISFSSCVVMN